MQPIVNVALRAARNAGQDLVRRLDRFDGDRSGDQEKAKFIADCAISLEKSAIFDLKKSHPEHRFHGFETGLTGNEESDTLWQIRIIDDVVNFRLGIPNFAVLITCLVNKKPEHAVLLNPMTNEEFSASRGRGAQLNNRRIRCDDSTTLDNAVVGMTQPKGLSEHGEAQTQRLTALLNKGTNVRGLGSNALSAAYVAAGRFQAALLSDVDEFTANNIALLVGEAGALMTDASGQPQIKTPAHVVITNPKRLKALLASVS